MEHKQTVWSFLEGYTAFTIRNEEGVDDDEDTHAHIFKNESLRGIDDRVRETEMTLDRS